MTQSRRGLSSTSVNYVKRLVAEANAHPSDPARQLRALQALGQIHPNLVVQRVEGHQFAMCQDVQREYLRALVKTSRMDTIDMNLFLARVQNSAGATTRAVHAHMNSDLTHKLGNYGRGEAYTRFWAFFGTVAWGCIVVTSVKAFIEEQHEAPRSPPMTYVGRALQLHMHFIDRDDNHQAGSTTSAPGTIDPPRKRPRCENEELTTPYENVWDINME
ncbi:hypothetical protein ACHHYP_20123 [Achlya hypogyna]|uniref:Uncharacterized protein n=1 Tax=Achlya hypogyna TaxID=1202772 RepID=A0A1V9ZRH5_ACHHY|nr:hypothetical protein ACHHYP_20123 [Achlya hypogyna]